MRVLIGELSLAALRPLAEKQIAAWTATIKADSNQRNTP
jgi:hypothetical protein